MSIQKVHDRRVAAVYQAVGTSKKLIDKKNVDAKTYLDGFMVDAFLALFYLLTRAENDKKVTMVWRTTDYLGFYGVKRIGGTNYTDSESGLLELLKGVPVFDGKAWSRIFPVYRITPIYLKRTIERAFAVNDRLIKEAGLPKEERERISGHLRERGLLLQKIHSLGGSSGFFERDPIERIEKIVSIKATDQKIADRRVFVLPDDAEDVIYDTVQIGDEKGLFETDDAGNIQPDLFGDGPKRIKKLGYKIELSENFLRDIREKRFSVLWVDRKYAVALMKHKASKQAIRLIFELMRYSSREAVNNGWVFDWTMSNLCVTLGIRTKKAKKVREAIRKAFKVCKEAGLIKEIPRPIEAGNGNPADARYRMKRDQITCPNGSQN